ncbi:hypothetical protein H4219_001876 [Mycoemilia scoparia]|uniref:Uncharacterized protein n=1 Tax=Mycoemilia scoparia TaxID=417184 RepID=A0A9W8DVI9_9FUNG|nr:hypothetical protein H4219_001876 [Mycoemilia scoparia]
MSGSNNNQPHNYWNTSSNSPTHTPQPPPYGPPYTAPQQQQSLYYPTQPASNLYSPSNQHHYYTDSNVKGNESASSSSAAMVERVKDKLGGSYTKYSSKVKPLVDDIFSSSKSRKNNSRPQSYDYTDSSGSNYTHSAPHDSEKKSGSMSALLSSLGKSNKDGKSNIFSSSRKSKDKKPKKKRSKSSSSGDSELFDILEEIFL